MSDIFILGIESSCDDTSAAVVKNGREVLSNVISSQTEDHVRYGGVVPEVASRKHIENIGGVIDKALDRIDFKLQDIDAIAVTCGPGLVGALLVGVAYAKGLAYSLDLPLLGIHHIEGHINANFIGNPELEPEFVSLVVSGGHTHLVRVKDYGEYEILGRTRDDAAGEAFDKIARALGLGYPGGPAIDNAARTGDDSAVNFPRAMLEQGSLDFSFSGLKSAALNYLNSQKMSGGDVNIPDVAASYQKAIVDVLVDKSVQACRAASVKTLALAGGVACNSRLRHDMSRACSEAGIRLYIPAPVYCADNAAMIAATGYYKLSRMQTAGLDLNAYPSLALDSYGRDLKK
jgi:N6-L-threonylcarbamoyladenine synthase